MIPTDYVREQHSKFSPVFVIIAVLFCTSLILSNFVASRSLFFWGITITAAELVFPISYILNDCLCEVYGYRKARFVIWLAFGMNIFTVLVTQLALLLPVSESFEIDRAYRTVFTADARATIASLLAFLAGSTLNAWVMSRMKILQKGKHFWIRSIVSSIVGELCDSIIFVPILFFPYGIKMVLSLIVCQVTAKVLYEILIMPVTRRIVARLKRHEALDVYDDGVSYNPLRFWEV